MLRIKMIRIKVKINNMLKTFSQTINEYLDSFKIDFIELYRNFTSQLSKIAGENKNPRESVSSALKDVFTNYQNSNNDNIGENFFIWVIHSILRNLEKMNIWN